jgi:serine/threonine protein kinase
VRARADLLTVEGYPGKSRWLSDEANGTKQLFEEGVYLRKKRQEYGKWRVLRSLSEGGQAHTFVVVDTLSASGPEYVLKRFKNPHRLDRYRVELQAISKLSHPNVIRLVDAQLEAAPYYIVTEHCAGGSLDKAEFLTELSLGKN